MPLSASGRPMRPWSRNLAATAIISSEDSAAAFPPAKSDDEIARLLDQMGAELGVFDPRAQKVTRTITGRIRRSPPRLPSSPPISIDTVRARVSSHRAPPPVPDWALDTVRRART